MIQFDTIGVTATRRGLTDPQLNRIGEIAVALKPKTLRHGSCRGGDVEIARLLRKLIPAIVIIAHPGPDLDRFREDSGVDDEVLPGKTHFARNRDIVNLSDAVLGAPLQIEWQPRGGTWYTLDFARKTGKPTWIVWPDGMDGTARTGTDPQPPGGDMRSHYFKCGSIDVSVLEMKHHPLSTFRTVLANDGIDVAKSLYEQWWATVPKQGAENSKLWNVAEEMRKLIDSCANKNPGV